MLVFYVLVPFNFTNFLFVKMLIAKLLILGQIKVFFFKKELLGSLDIRADFHCYSVHDNSITVY
jgi:hypothetical protein